MAVVRVHRNVLAIDNIHLPDAAYLGVLRNGVGNGIRILCALSIASVTDVTMGQDKPLPPVALPPSPASVPTTTVHHITAPLPVSTPIPTTPRPVSSWTPVPIWLPRIPDKPAQNLNDQSRDQTCPQCGRGLRRRSGKYGKLWGYSGYPYCLFTRSARGKRYKTPVNLDCLHRPKPHRRFPSGFGVREALTTLQVIVGTPPHEQYIGWR